MPKHALSQKTNREIDEILGIQKYQLQSDPEYYDPKIFYTDGLTSADALYSDYQDLLSIYELLMGKGIKSFCDLGAGIGRAKLLFDYLRAPFKSYSIEFVKERHQEGLRAHQSLGLPFSEGFIHADLSQSPPPPCECYFLYMPVNDVLIQTLDFLEELHTARKGYLLAIESHGDLLSYLESTHPYLKVVARIPLKSKRHHEEMVLYQFNPTKGHRIEKNAALKKIAETSGALRIEVTSEDSFWMLWKQFKNHNDLQILVEDNNGQWLADLKDSLFGIQPQTLETAHPYRIIKLEEIKAIIRPPTAWLEFIEKRRLQERGPLGEMRKLFVSPFPQVEYSRGQKKELEITWRWEWFTTLRI